MDSYEVISREFLWPLSDIQKLSRTERENWVKRSARFKEL